MGFFQCVLIQKVSQSFKFSQWETFQDGFRGLGNIRDMNLAENLGAAWLCSKLEWQDFGISFKVSSSASQNGDGDVNPPDESTSSNTSWAFLIWF